MIPRERDVRGAVFAIKSNISQLRAQVQLTGYLDMETVPQLRVFLDQMTQDMAAGVVRDFEFDISLLYLMSSSSISCFAAWIKHTKDAFPASRVKFCTNPSLVWQSRALIPIRRLAEDIVSIA